MPTEPTGENIGCAPSSLRSKIERRRCASTAFGQVFTPSPSGPRRASVASMRPTRFCASSRFPAPTKPAMPHILKIVFSHEKAQIYFSSAARPKLAPKLQNQQQPNIRGRLHRTVLRPRHEVADVVETKRWHYSAVATSQHFYNQPVEGHGKFLPDLRASLCP